MSAEDARAPQWLSSLGEMFAMKNAAAIAAIGFLLVVAFQLLSNVFLFFLVPLFSGFLASIILLPLKCYVAQALDAFLADDSYPLVLHVLAVPFILADTLTRGALGFLWHTPHLALLSALLAAICVAGWTSGRWALEQIYTHCYNIVVSSIPVFHELYSHLPTQDRLNAIFAILLTSSLCFVLALALMPSCRGTLSAIASATLWLLWLLYFMNSQPIICVALVIIVFVVLFGVFAASPASDISRKASSTCFQISEPATPTRPSRARAPQLHEAPRNSPERVRHLQSTPAQRGGAPAIVPSTASSSTLQVPSGGDISPDGDSHDNSWATVDSTPRPIHPVTPISTRRKGVKGKRGSSLAPSHLDTPNISPTSTPNGSPGRTPDELPRDVNWMLVFNIATALVATWSFRWAALAITVVCLTLAATNALFWLVTDFVTAWFSPRLAPYVPALRDLFLVLLPYPVRQGWASYERGERAIAASLRTCRHFLAASVAIGACVTATALGLLFVGSKVVLSEVPTLFTTAIDIVAAFNMSLPSEPPSVITYIGGPHTNTAWSQAVTLSRNGSAMNSTRLLVDVVIPYVHDTMKSNNVSTTAIDTISNMSLAIANTSWAKHELRFSDLAPLVSGYLARLENKAGLLKMGWVVLDVIANVVIRVASSSAIAMEIFLFFSCVFYLLRGERFEPLVWTTHFFDDRLPDVIQTNLRQVLLMSLHMAAFHATLTWLTYRFFDLPAVYISAILSALIALVPIIGTYWMALPGVLVLWLRGDLLGLLLLIAMHLLGGFVVDPLLYASYSASAHHFITSLSVVGGILGFGLPGGVLGPVLLVFFLDVYDAIRRKMAAVQPL
eukprot:m.98756 g.98756  ORF g.98756 m.98756 type:complete len:844 (+) comp8700_c0_seq4:45-2576(+)